MEPIEAVNKEAFAAYINDYAEGLLRTISPSEVPNLLRYWNEAKLNWFHTFGDKLILKKPICYTEDVADTEDRMRELTLTPEYKEIYETLKKKLYELFHYGHEYYEVLSLLDPATLASNYYIGFDTTLSFPKPIKIQHGCKPLRTLHKILHAMDFPEETFEVFRIAHSQVLNSRKVYGTLCLSIDPLDYITMSDNDLGWDSCMRWMDNGEYHGGTIEMMNSPTVLMAYIEADEPFYPCGDCYPFSNKKWRQLIIADPTIILGNRHYPFECPEVEKEALLWTKSLMDASSFQDSIVPIYNHNPNISINTDIMYNDVYGARNGILPKKPVPVNINYSGVRNCMCCGNPIEDDCPAEWVICPDCANVHTCDCCGSYIPDSEPYWSNDDGEYFCRDCVECREITFCGRCDQPHFDNDISSFSVDLAPEDSTYGDEHWTNLCPHCYSLVPFGDLGEKDEYGNYRYDRMTPSAQAFIDELEL